MTDAISMPLTLPGGLPRLPAAGQPRIFAHQKKTKRRSSNPRKKVKRTKRKTKKKAKPKALAFPIETSDLMRETLALEAGERQTVFARALAFIRHIRQAPPE